MKKSFGIIAVLVGFIFLGLSLMYWLTPAGGLPTFVPGYEVGVSTVHFKHGLACLLLGVALFVYAWFQGGPQSKTQ